MIFFSLVKGIAFLSRFENCQFEMNIIYRFEVFFDGSMEP